jgi:hypothetical protein
MSQTGELRGRELQRVVFVVVISVQIDRISLAAALGHSHHIDEELQALLRLRSKEFKMA